MPELIKTEATLTRNGETVPLYLGELGKASKENSGLKFPYPVVDPVTFERDVTMVGKDFVAESITRTLRRIFASIQIECWNKETGEVDAEQWQEMAQGFTEGDEKRDILQAKKNDLSDRLVLITDTEEFNSDPLKFTDQVREIGESIKAINIQLVEIQTKIDATTALRNATKAKKAAELAARQEAIKAQKAGLAGQPKEDIS